MHSVNYPVAGHIFYRVGWYDNIFDTDRMSLYVKRNRLPRAAPSVDLPAHPGSE